MQRIVLAFDKFRGTATSAQLSEAVAPVLRSVGWAPVVVPLADGGEGSLDVLGGANRWETVLDPLGRPIEAGWRLDGHEAFIEMSAASGLHLVGGRAGNAPLAATTRGTGQLVAAALDAGATAIHVFLGGSATTDGGAGAVEVVADHPRLAEAEIYACVDVTTRFVGAAAVFGPQKGASTVQVQMLEERLAALADRFVDDFGVDVRQIEGSGAAGGLAGGLAAIGAQIRSGFGVLADRAGLADVLADAHHAFTGEGRFDAGSLQGKVVGGVADAAWRAGVPVTAVVGVAADGVGLPAGDVISLTERYGRTAAMGRTTELVTEIVAEVAGAPSR